MLRTESLVERRAWENYVRSLEDQYEVRERQSEVQAPVERGTGDAANHRPFKGDRQMAITTTYAPLDAFGCPREDGFSTVTRRGRKG